MATKTFNDICVEYAHQLGKGLPLTPAEMCNAVIMYLNAQITEMQGITTALQTAVTEAEASATEATNTANELSGKVDTLQTAVTEAEASATEALNRANDVSETVNALPKVPKPTTSDNGKVIGVQSGAYALVEQSNEPPDNMVTTDTPQLITAKKGITAMYYSNKFIQVGNYSDENLNDIINGGSIDSNVTTEVQITNTSVNLSSYDSGRPTDGVTLERGSDHTEGFTDYGNYYVSYGLYSIYATKYTDSNKTRLERYYYGFPFKSGMLAVESDIPNLDNYTGTVHIVQGTAGSGIAVHDTANTSPYTKYGYDKIETYGNSNALQYTLNIPNKNGTIATLDDIGSPSETKYFTRVIFHNTDEDTQYILFSCVTNENLSSNTSYTNVVSLLSELGATTQDTALPCTGKTVTGGIVVGVYTDGTNIIVFDTDNTPEELTMSSEIKFISK